MKFFYSDTANIDLPPGHRFPGTKYSLLRRKLVDDRILHPVQLVSSPMVEDEDLARAHDRAYIASIDTGTIDASAMRRIGFPWSMRIPVRSRKSVGGAVAAARSALETGLSGQLAGGTHHAHRDFGAGYCVFNDLAVAALTLLETHTVRRLAIVDLDVHQGDGNAAILGTREDTFVLSVHGEKNFPFRKHQSHLDIGLADEADDAAYMRALAPALEKVFAFKPDIILYQAGVDPLAEDKLGRLSLTYEGLMARDYAVFSGCKARAIPVSIAMGGGYADPIEQSVMAYANTYLVAKKLYGF